MPSQDIETSRKRHWHSLRIFIAVQNERSNLEFSECKPDPMSCCRDFKKIAKDKIQLYIHLRNRVAPLSPFRTIIPFFLLRPLPLAVAPTYDGVRKWLELSNVKCKVQYYRVRPRLFTSLPLFPFLSFFLAFCFNPIR